MTASLQSGCLLSDSLPSSRTLDQNVASHAVAAAAPQFDPTHLNPSVSPFLPGLATSQDSTNLLNSHLTAVPNVYLIIMLPVLPNVMHCNCYHLIFSSLMLMLVVSLKPGSQPKCLKIILPSTAFRCIGEIVRNVKVEVFVATSRTASSHAFIVSVTTLKYFGLKLISVVTVFTLPLVTIPLTPSTILSTL